MNTVGRDTAREIAYSDRDHRCDRRGMLTPSRPASGASCVSQGCFRTGLLTCSVFRIGWAVLSVAGGGAYFFAKRSIDADRQARFQAEQAKKARVQRYEESQYMKFNSEPPTSTKSGTTKSTKGLDHAGSPSSEISEDVAPVGHAPVNHEQRVREKSKYEAAEPYRSKKGNRFSD
jgi:hypothetical protein